MSHLDYNPLQWPPDISLAKLHFDCCKPGIDNTQGRRCPCCNRLQKLSNSRWPLRDIVKDFKNYGGGVPGYFHLLLYLMAILVILCGVNVVYHIMMLEQVCPTLAGTHSHCTVAFGVFIFCNGDILYNTLASQGRQAQADTLEYIQLATYLILVIATIGIKVVLHIVNKGRDLDGKLFSRFSLVIKNVPLYYQLEDLREELKAIDPSISINQMFYLYKTCECQTNLRAVCDLYFQLKNAEQNLKMDDRQKYMEQYKKMKQNYLKLYDKYQKQSQNLKASSKKVIVVFNTIDQKERIHKALRMNQLIKFCHYLAKILGCKKDPIGYYSQRLAEPQQINWKYIGESSTRKLKVRIQTTLLGIGLIAVSFGIFYVPMIQVDKDKVEDPGAGTALGFIMSIVIFFLTIIYRTIIVKLIPTRRPSSKLAQGYFIVMTCTIFNFFFYLIIPACFYLFINTIPQNIKLKELFMASTSFCIFSTILNIIDIGYRSFNGKKNKLLSKVSQANVYCQSRLHEQVTPPAFPVHFKLVMIFNVWIFNSFYIFNIPYLLTFFFGVILILYWVDKYFLYNHYKMQSYLSLQLEHKAQKIFLVVFLICVSLGYLTITQYNWQRYLIIVVFVIGLIVNFSLQFAFKKQKDQILKHNSDLKSAIAHCKSNFLTANHLSMMEIDLRNSLILNDPKALALQLSEASLATAIIMYGYQQTYNLYLSQFNKKQVNTILQAKYFQIKKSISRISGSPVKRRQSQLAQLVEQSIEKKLIDTVAEQKQIDNKSSISQEYVVKIYEPPKIQSRDLKKQNHDKAPKIQIKNQIPVKEKQNKVGETQSRSQEQEKKLIVQAHPTDLQQDNASKSQGKK